MMGKKSSIEKLNAQIDMLTNEDFVDQNTEMVNKKREKATPRKEIQEEIDEDDLFSDLKSDHEDTKVFAAKDISNDNIIEQAKEVFDESKTDSYIYYILIGIIIAFLLLIIII